MKATSTAAKTGLRLDGTSGNLVKVHKDLTASLLRTALRTHTTAPGTTKMTVSFHDGPQNARHAQNKC